MKQKMKKIIFISIIIMSITFTTSLTFGKYTYNSVWNYFLKSRGFYFESDLLASDVKKNSILKWDGSNISFTIKNSVNRELISEYDISYKITCNVLGEEKEYIDCYLNGTESSEFTGNLSSLSSCVNNINLESVDSLTKTECEMSGYEWKQEIATKDIYFNLELTKETETIDEVAVEIVAESLTPYHKTLKGIFYLNRVELNDETFLTDFQSFNNYDELTIINTSKDEKCFLINFDSNKFLFDLNKYEIVNHEVDSNDLVNSFEVKIDKEKSSVYSFFKIDNQNSYLKDNLTVEEKNCSN